MSVTRKSLLIHGLFCALLLLALFMFRSNYQPFYNHAGHYALATLAIVLGVLLLYFYSLVPNRARGEGNLNWYVMRGWSMGLVAAFAAALLIGGYAYQVDDDYFSRRMGWEEQLLENEHLPEEIVSLFLEDEKLTESMHLEEIGILFLAGVSAAVGAIVVSFFFIGSNKRDAKFHLEPSS
jgi:hypothetical protein